jgi:hypothetical protein
MTRFVLMTLLLAGALVAEETAAGLPWLGPAAPDMGLLFVLAYAMKGPGRDVEVLCLLAGIMKGAVCGLPAGFFVLAYLGVSRLVLLTRGHLFLEFVTTQMIVVFLAGCLVQAARALAAAGGLIPAAEWGTAAPVLSCLTAALLAPLAVKIHDRSRLIRIMFRP